MQPAAPDLRVKRIEPGIMTRRGTTNANHPCDPPPAGGIAGVRAGVRKAVLRYLRWRAASHMKKVDPRVLADFGLHPEKICSIMRGLDTGDADHAGSTRQ